MELFKLRCHLICISIIMILSINRSASEIDEEDDLSPYQGHHGPVNRRLRDTQQCQHQRYGNTTFSLTPAHSDLADLERVVDVHHKLTTVGPYYVKRNVNLRIERVYNPARTLSVVEPGQAGSCEASEGVRASVRDTAVNNNCVFAANAGFFNTHTGQCLGNIVSDGRIVRDSQGIQNVHFGITKQGQIFTGYLSEIELVTLQFRQLVGGVVWLLRDGEVYVDESRDIECPDTEETGTLDRFITVISARTAVGHNAEGHVMMVQVDGKTDQQGVDLHEFAGLLKDLGFVNAINLDGGGSATSVVNGTVVNYPSDQCVNSTWNCEREVSTVLCVHQARCVPDPLCSGHGQCRAGLCQCQPPWSGQSCDLLTCLNHCSDHGSCREDGCACDGGWWGEDCSRTCEKGTFGVNCSEWCQCQNEAVCHPVSGRCLCKPGYTGSHCETKCGYGWYGEGCGRQCDCGDQCFCHHVTGQCSNTSADHRYFNISQCLVAAAIRRDRLVPDQTEQLLMWRWIAAAGGVVAVISVAINVMLALALLCSKRSRSPRRSPQRSSWSSHHKPRRKRFIPKQAAPKNNNSSWDTLELLPLRRGGGHDSSLDDSSDNS